MMTSEQLAQAQLNAYNARNLDAFCACYADDVTVRTLPDQAIVVQGMTAFRPRYVERFKSTQLHCKLLSRMVQGDFVIDHEEIFGFDPAHPDVPHYAIAIYECDAAAEKIKSVWFIR
jgi:hypothetical protein